MEHQDNENNELREVEQIPALQILEPSVAHLDDFQSKKEQLGEVADGVARFDMDCSRVEYDHEEGDQEEDDVDFQQGGEVELSQRGKLVVNDLLDGLLLVELNTVLDHQVGDIPLVADEFVFESNLLTDAQHLEVDETVLDVD